MRWKFLQDQRGVAMVTVLFIGAALTAVTSVAAIAAVQEFRAGNDDRRAVGALAYAEAGVDRMLAVLRTGELNFGELNKLGCSVDALTVEGQVGGGEFEATLRVYNPTAVPAANRFPVGAVPTTGGACANRPTSPHPGMDGQDNTYFVIESEGRHPAASRLVRQVIALTPLKLPVGIYGNTVSVQSQNHVFAGISMVSKTSITSRNLLSFSGVDNYYKMSDFYEAVSGVAGGLGAPAYAAAHSEGTIFVRTVGGLGSNTPEFSGGANTKNCSANGSAGGALPSNSIWDSDRSTGAGRIDSGCTGNTTGFPTSSVFSAEKAANFAKPELTEQDHQTLAEAAKNRGVYCSFPGVGAPPSDSTSTCFVRGVSQNNPLLTSVQGYIDGVSNGAYTNGVPVNDFVAYVHFRYGSAQSNNLIRPVADIWPCSDNPALHSSVVLVVKGGGVSYPGGAGSRINGAFIMDGDWSGTGGLLFNGSLIAKGNVAFHSSSQTFTTDACWVRNMPGSFLQTVQNHWSEVDR